ncbi:MAG: hydantoinase/oxoprolinase family protein [Chloroflexi bacterium]|nr:hydantoinase/oxoprolinase family protein [Chloroflexota bacterium]
MIGIDTGGTFTDVIRVDDDGSIRLIKIPSTPTDPAQSFLDGVREIGGDGDHGDQVVHGSTVGTNAVLERRGAGTAVITTRGMADVIEIGRQARNDLYSLRVTRPVPLVSRELRFEIDERVTAEGEILKAPSAAELGALAELVAASRAETVAVALLFSFLRPEHEQAVREALRRRLPANFPISLSSEVVPEFREFERTSTTVLNAYVAPVMQSYLSRIDETVESTVRIMSSNGGSMTIGQASSFPVETLLSGPAGGVVGAFEVARAAGFDRIITLDMGGTSTDVSLCDGEVQRTSEGSIGGYPLRVPIVDIHTVGAGGGSLASVDAGGALTVGPESAGADPGPAAYGRGGGPTVTDANIVLGRLSADRPLAGRMVLDGNAALAALGGVAQELGITPQQAAAGVARIANANMEQALRVVSLEQGHDPRDFTLVAFGGAGPLHACELADGLGIGSVLIPRMPGALSAWGMLSVDVTRDYSRTAMRELSDTFEEEIARLLGEIEQDARRDLEAVGLSAAQAIFSASADIRYQGQGYELSIPLDAPDGLALEERFHAAHLRRFDHSHPDWPTEVVTLRLRAAIPARRPEVEVADTDGGPDASHALLGETTLMADAGEAAAPLYDRDALLVGNLIAGPAVLTQTDCTTFVPPGWVGRVDEYLNLILERASA